MSPVPDPLHALHAASAASSLERELDEARGRVKAAREAQKRAELEVVERGRISREQARANDRRALLVGRVALTLATNDRELWDYLHPLVTTSLKDAVDTDRALFGLPAAAIHLRDGAGASAGPAETTADGRG